MTAREQSRNIFSGIDKKMIALGFSSHGPIPFEPTWSMKESNLDDYLKEIDKWKNTYTSLNLYKGLEADAHHPAELTQEFEPAYLLSSLGFKTIQALYDGHWQAVTFSEKGLILPAT
jgi:histidinol-phosphatase (PHP family)